MNELKDSLIQAKIDEDGVLINAENSQPIDASEAIKTSDIYIVEAGSKTLKEHFATGVAIPKYRQTSWDYLNDIKDFNVISENDIYKHIEVCNKLYRFEPMIGTAIDIFVDFAITNFDIQTDNKELNNIFDYLHKEVNQFEPTSDYLYAYPSGLKALVNEIAHEWFISGNVFPYHEWKKKSVNGKVYRMPTHILNLNPNSFLIERLKNPIGAVKMTYFPDGAPHGGDSQDINGTTINTNNSKPNNLSYTSIKNLIGSSGQSFNHSLVYHIKRKASGFKLWGLPYLTRTFSAVKAKRKLRYLDDATIDGLVNYVVVFKIGSPDKDSPFHKPSNARLNAFASLINNPSASNMLVWPHDVDVITIGPDNKVLEFKDRYEIVDKDITRSLGLPTVLFDGSGEGSINIAWMSALSLVEKLENVRDSINDYFNFLFRQIAQQNNLEYKKLKFIWRPTNLRDEKTIKTMLLAFYDRGLLPIESTLFYSGYDPDEMISLKKKEFNSELDKYFQRRDIPYSPNPTTPQNKIVKNGDEGRAVDNTKDKTNIKTPSQSSANQIVELTLGKFKENMSSEIDTLYDELKETRKIDTKVEDRILASFLRLKQISDVLIHMELKTSNTEASENVIDGFYEWKNNYLNEIHSGFITNWNDNLLYLRKSSVAHYVTAGVFTETKGMLNSFCDKITGMISFLSDFNNEVVFSFENKTISAKADEIFKYIPFDKDFIYQTTEK